MEFTGPTYVLKQNNPNPVGSKTEISFALGMEAATTLELFGADGRRVGVLVDETLAAGEHSVTLDARDLSSGLYYYRLTSGPFSAIRHMLVTK
jgi:hypothetical protein